MELDITEVKLATIKAIELLYALSDIAETIRGAKIKWKAD